MAKGPTTSEESIEALEKRYQDLNRRKIQAETSLDLAKKSLEELRKQALAKYGTDDLDKLREQLAAMKAENEQKRKNYQTELEAIETRLAEVEQSFTATEAAGANGQEKR